MLDMLLGSHWTVTFLCAAWYCWVSCFRPALSAAVIGPVFGGRTALIVTEALLPVLPELAGRCASHWESDSSGHGWPEELGTLASSLGLLVKLAEGLGSSAGAGACLCAVSS